MLTRLLSSSSFAFALVDPATFQLAKGNSYDDQLWPKVAALKLRNPSLKVCLLP
jgi:chitinase